MSTPTRVTELLQRWQLRGDADAEQKLFALVESQLLRIARATLNRHSGFGHKIDPRELVNEAYLALHGYTIDTFNRAPFYALMAKAMRHFLMDTARRGRAAKRPRSQLRVVDTDVLYSAKQPSDVDVLDFYRALDALRKISQRQAETLELRVLGLKNEEIAQQRHVSVATVKRDLAEGRAFVAYQLGLSSHSIRA